MTHSPTTDPATRPTKPSVLFVCVKNGGKSQMAAGLMTKRAGDTVTVESAGTKPGTAVNALSAESLAEVGVDISANTPKPITAEMVKAADVVVTLGREAHVDEVPATRFENWDTDEPSERGIDGIERMRLVRDDIARRVDDLYDRLIAGADRACSLWPPCRPLRASVDGGVNGGAGGGTDPDQGGRGRAAPVAVAEEEQRRVVDRPRRQSAVGDGQPGTSGQRQPGEVAQVGPEAGAPHDRVRRQLPGWFVPRGTRSRSAGRTLAAPPGRRVGEQPAPEAPSRCRPARLRPARRPARCRGFGVGGGSDAAGGELEQRAAVDVVGQEPRRSLRHPDRPTARGGRSGRRRSARRSSHRRPPAPSGPRSRRPAGSPRCAAAARRSRPCPGRTARTAGPRLPVAFTRIGSATPRSR